MNKQTQTIVLLVAAAAVVYFIMSKPAVATPLPVAYNPNLHPVTNAGNSTAAEIAAGGVAASSIIDAISNISSDDES